MCKHPEEAGELLQVLKKEVRIVTYPNYSVDDDYWLTYGEVMSDIDSIITSLPKDKEKFGRK